MSQSVNVNQLFQNAKEEGLISKAGMQSLTLVDIGKQIQPALGIPAIEVQASEVVLVTLMIDDSGSIRFAGNSQIIRDGHNLIIDSLKDSKQGDNILAHTRYLNGFELYPYCLIEQAIKMDTHNYDPSLGTPLYDQTVALLGTVLAKTLEFRNTNVPVRGITVIVTDGHDEHSVKATPTKIAPLVRDMLLQENQIIAAMGIDDGGHTDFRKVFREMGLRDEWILTPDNTASEIRKCFQLTSRSAVRASQSALSFKQTSVGGFGK